MNFNKAANEHFIKMCAIVRWNWLLSLPWAAGMTMAEIGEKLKSWISEIETADGTMGFRFALIIPRDQTSREFHVLVGGLGSGKWWYWTRRWAAIMGDRQLRGSLLYGFPGEKRGPTSALKHLLVGKKFDFEMRIGPATIQCSRMMDVDESGMPIGGEALLIPVASKKTHAGSFCTQLGFQFPTSATVTKVATQTVTKAKVHA